MAWLWLCPLQNKIQIQIVNNGLNFGSLEVTFLTCKRRTKNEQHSYTCTHKNYSLWRVISGCLHSHSVAVAIFLSSDAFEVSNSRWSNSCGISTQKKTESMTLLQIEPTNTSKLSAAEITKMQSTPNHRKVVWNIYTHFQFSLPPCPTVLFELYGESREWTWFTLFISNVRSQGAQDMLYVDLLHEYWHIVWYRLSCSLHRDTMPRTGYSMLSGLKIKEMIDFGEFLCKDITLFTKIYMT